MFDKLQVEKDLVNLVHQVTRKEYELKVVDNENKNVCAGCAFHDSNNNDMTPECEAAGDACLEGMYELDTFESRVWKEV